MVINWYGEGSFKIQSGGLTILTDPFDSSTGLTPPRFKSDIVLTSGAPEPYTSSKMLEGQHIFGPGEYEVQGIEVNGFPAAGGAIYIVKTEEMKLGFLGQLSSLDLSPDAMTALRGIDILFIPIGGAPYLDSPSATKLIKQLEPKIVIPAFYKILGLKRAATGIEDFIKTFGQKSEPQEKLTIKAKDINWEGTKLIILTI